MHARISSRSLVGALLIAGTLVAVAGDWPQWRGPKRDGKSSDTALLAQWPTDGPQLLWKTNGIGEGFFSVAIFAGKIFTMGDGPDWGFLTALDLEYGEL